MLADGQLPHELEQRARAAILYRTHFWSPDIEAEVFKLIAAAGDDYDVWVIGYVAPGGDFAVPAPVRKITFVEHHLRAMGLPRCPRHPQLATRRNLELPPLFFFRMLPVYEHYWVIEYDVRYTGDWRTFFSEFHGQSIDLLGTVLQTRSENPNWHFWPGLCTANDKVSPDRHTKMFTPMFRLSNRGFQAVDLAYRRGWHGHQEAVWATAVAAAGQTIEDIGGSGSFTPAHRRERHYRATYMHPELIPGSFVFRPVKSEAEIQPEPPMLWHPVKPRTTAAWFPTAVNPPGVMRPGAGKQGQGGFAPLDPPLRAQPLEPDSGR